MMYKQFFFFLIVAVVAGACLKSNGNNSCPYATTTVNIPQSERDAIDTYIDTNHIDAVQDRSGFYYQILSPGTGTDTMTLCSNLQISYKGQLINDSTFDQQENMLVQLGQLIEGWRRGIPKIKRGGEIKLWIPPTLGYGSTDITDQSGKVVIPKNSILKFDIKLIDYTAGN